MQRALSLARRGQGLVKPNPMVGCVIVSKGRVVAEGYHKNFGGPHAEIEALRRAGPLARGSTVYVTLEPCCAHAGKKTPPCTRALILAGVKRVVAAIMDPNPRVSGRGIKELEAAGIKAEVGLYAVEAENLNRGFFTRMRLNRPYITLKTALSLDGKAATPSGKSRWITGPRARRAGHKLRAQSDAVLVGIGTVLADNPSLTSHGGGKNPLRVVLDRNLRIPRHARCLGTSAPTLIFTASKKNIPGVETLRVPASEGKLSLAAVVKILAQRGVDTLLVEGGPTVHASFLKAGLVDNAMIFLSPKLISGSKNPNQAPRLASTRLSRIGPDFLIAGKVKCSRE